ncbi:MAG: hypothetical protein JNL73_14220 [Anaerolineales bacterium]|nr:hypothetical protein [Anaerolineales bacterium]
MSHKIYTRAPEAMTDLDQIEAGLRLLGYSAADRPVPGQLHYTRNAHDLLVSARCFPASVHVLSPTYEYLGYRRTASRAVERIVDDMYVDTRTGQISRAPAAFEPLIHQAYLAAGITAALTASGIAFTVQTAVSGDIEILPELPALSIGAVSTGI